MPIDVKFMPDEPILMCLYYGELILDDLRHVETESTRLIAHLKAPVSRIHDTRQLEISFGEVVIMLADAAGQTTTPGSLLDPNFKDIVVVAPGSLVELATKSLSQDQYGALNVAMVESMEEALTLARG